MKQLVQYASAVLVGFVAIGCGRYDSTAPRDPQAPSYSVERLDGRTGFSVHGTVVSSKNEVIEINGGGSFDPSSGSNVLGDQTNGHGNGGFSCVTDITAGQLAGCTQGEGTHWDTVQLLQSAGFKCGGVANEQKKTAVTSGDVIVLQADFYRAGDGKDASFHTQMFVANYDLAPDVPGFQNVWIQGFGCGTATVNFSSAHGL